MCKEADNWKGLVVCVCARACLGFSLPRSSPADSGPPPPKVRARKGRGHADTQLRDLESFRARAALVPAVLKLQRMPAPHRVRVRAGVGCQRTEGPRRLPRAGAGSAYSCTYAAWLTGVGGKV